jgi:hypothetical protein
MPIICEGCGQPVPLPDGYRRNKIQCACGVICPVLESSRQETLTSTRTRPTPAAKPQPAAEEEGVRWLLDDDSSAPKPRTEPPPFRAAEPVEEPAPATKPALVEMRFNCRRCGRLVRRQGECPSCDADKMPSGQPVPVLRLSLDEPVVEEEEDASPYGVAGADEIPCPQCRELLPPDSVLCVRCGFHVKKRKKVARTYQPIEREWETNVSHQKRLTVLWICEAVALGLGLTSVFGAGAGLGIFLGSFLSFTAIMAFLLGTFDRIRLTRDARGRVRLIKTWRFCFFERPPQTIDVRGYEGIVSGRRYDVGILDWLIFFFLLFPGLIPGLVWWYWAIHKVSFHVSLSRDHGFPSYIVYSGRNEMQMKEIALELKNATGLRSDVG